MKIFIPTLGRADKQFTLDQMSKKLRKHTWLVVQAFEKDDYDYPRLMVLPPDIITIAPTRQWILDNCTDNFMFMLDDDLDFFKRVFYEDGIKLERCSKKELDIMFLDVLLKDLRSYGLVGVSTRWENRLIEGSFKTCGKMACMYGFNLSIIRASKVRFGEAFDNPFKSDVGFVLQFLLSGRRNHIRADFAHQQSKGFQAPGGCSSIRTPEIMEDANRKFEAAFPDYVKMYEKEEGKFDESKGLWKYQTRVRWKKAYEAGVAERLENRRRLP